MHLFLSDLDDSHVVSRHPHELTIVRDGLVGKLTHAPIPEQIRFVDVDGVPSWRHVHWLTEEEISALELDDGPWVLVVRDHVEGRTLREAWLDDAQALSIALRLTYRLRDLHECGHFHGDLQPANIIIDAAHDPWLIDLSVVHTHPGERGHVAGSVALMAPELWGGAPPSHAADVYALGALCVWLLSGRYPFHAESLAQWAIQHREQEPTISGLPARVAGVVRRMLSKDDAARPPLQELIDALIEMGATADLPPVAAGGIDTVTLDVGELIEPQHVVVVGGKGSGKSTAARRLIASAAAARVPMVLMEGPRPAVSLRPFAPDGGPWSSVYALAAAIGQEHGVDLGRTVVGRGDRLHVFEQLTDLVIGAMGGRPLVIAWDDFDLLRPDTRAWWRHFRDVCERRSLAVSTYVFAEKNPGAPGAQCPIGELDGSTWSRWRASTLRSEVRTIPQARWKQITADHGGRVGTMLRALDAELGTRGGGTARAEAAWDTDRLLAVQAGWRERVRTLAEQCAFAEIVETCRGLYQSLRDRDRGDDETYYELLTAWTDATIGAGGVEMAAPLEAALVDHASDAKFAILLARLHNALGRHEAGLKVLDDVAPVDGDTAAEIQCWRAQLALSSGRMQEARSFAEAGLAVGGGDAEIEAHLTLLFHAPQAIAGTREALEALGELATRFDAIDAPHLLRARLHAYRAIGLGRADLLDEATDAHLRALEQVELGGLAAELPTYLLNAGTAYHRQGRLGLAREYYARGLRVAQSTTRASTRALLLANQANVDLALGRLDEAAELVRRGLDVARNAGLGAIEAMTRSVGADIELARGDTREARSAYLDILQDATLQLSHAQQAEIRLSLVEAALLEGDLVEASTRMNEARRLIEEHALDDLEHHHGMLRARLQWAEGGDLETMAGIELFRRHLLAARDAGNHRLVLRQAPYLGHQLEGEGLDELLDELTEVVQGARNAVVTGLGRELRRDFFAQLPALRSVPRPPEASAAPRPARAPSPVAVPASAAPAASTSVEPFYRMLSLNEVILRSDQLDDVLPDGLDIAMSLSGAERAFVLLRDESKGRVGAFAVAASRDVDGRPIPSPHLEVSLTIAEEAARTGRTVVTLNAREDRRFSQALSVVDLDLTSVLCVPVRDASGLLGALYLDHRFQPGIFEGEVPRMMEAFGHQLALAINNARRLEELRGERGRLAETQEQLAQLLAERESELHGLERRCAELADQVQRAHADATVRAAFPDIAFGSRAMERVLVQVERVARGDIPVVVTGESGVGKELIARAIHEHSPRRRGPFVAFNCGAVSETLFESEMFGHIKGAFTGADIDREGLFTAADGGTIFLDEIGEMPLSMQVKLLRVLQERQIRRVGETRNRPIDVRVVAATNRDLGEMVSSEEFREDLYYRLAAFVIEIPPLRDRREDIPLIAAQLIGRIGEETGRHVRLHPEAAQLLRQCDWPGNVRELENTLRTAVVMTDGEEVDASALAPLVRVRSAADSRPSAPTARGETRGRRRKANRADVVEAMRRAGDDRLRAAEILGVSERTLYRYLKRWDLY